VPFRPGIWLGPDGLLHATCVVPTTEPMTHYHYTGDRKRRRTFCGQFSQCFAVFPSTSRAYQWPDEGEAVTCLNCLDAGPPGGEVECAEL